MRTIIIRAGLIALVLTPLFGFLQMCPYHFVTWDPPIIASDFKDMRHEDAVKQINARRRTLSTMDSLRLGIRDGWLWPEFAKRSSITYVSIFSGCVSLWFWQRKLGQSD